MEALLGFLTVIAAELLRLLICIAPNQMLRRPQSPVQLHVLKARLSKLPKVFTVAGSCSSGAVRGYLNIDGKHRLAFRFSRLAS